jgi:phage/plasmid-associated DNA primase
MRNGFKDISVEKVRKKYEEKSNTVKAFLDADCTIDISDPLCNVLTTDMYAAYCNFCKENNERPIDMKVFGKQLAQYGIERKQMKRYGDKSYYYIGVKLKYDFRAADSNSGGGGGGVKKNETLA